MNWAETSDKPFKTRSMGIANIRGGGGSLGSSLIGGTLTGGDMMCVSEMIAIYDDV